MNSFAVTALVTLGTLIAVLGLFAAGNLVVAPSGWQRYLGQV